MKKLLIALTLLIASQGVVQASHVLGGEIRWECLSNGRFVFFAKVFRDCTGITYPFDNKTLEIVGNPLPRSTTNSTISSIILKPDSNTWINNRFGDTSPTCAPGGATITCGNGDEGAIQQFFFQSDPIQLKGTPPSNGWKFYLVQPCCRPNVTNLAAGGTMMLRAIMYPDKQSNTVDNCKDSSPEFLALPTNMLCRGYEFTYNHTAIDKDLDSLVYGWDRTYNSPPVAPQPVPFANGYSQSNPTPDRTFNTNNIPAQLNPLTGQVTMGVWSGSPLTLDYLTVIRVDAYREGRVIASVFREIPFVFFDCPRLPSGQINRPPEIFIDGDSADGIIVDIVAGQRVTIPFQAVDLDFSGGIPGLQRVTVEPAGFMFSKDLRDSNNCVTNTIAPCAVLRNQNPSFNNVAEPPRWEVSGYAGIATEFIWDTRCHHIASLGTGVPGQNEGIYNFVMRTYDDHCPIPGINYPTITVKVRDPLPLQQPIMKGVSVNLDGTVIYQWAPPLDTATSHFKYLVEFNQPNNGFPPAPTAYQSLNNNEKRYRSERRTNAMRVYLPDATGDPNVDADEFSKVPNKDFYVRMQTISGCTEDVPSVWSQPARVIELDVTPSGNVPQAPLRSEATLNWNRAKALNANSHPYYHYESPTRFYVWTNDNINVTSPAPGNYNGHDIASNWLLRGNTYSNTYEVGSTTCSGWVAFRVEARDTVIAYRQGSRPRLTGPPNPQFLDTMVFSTFSTLDTMYMENPGFIPNPKFDTLEVRVNGDIFMRVDAGGAGTTGEYRIYNTTVAPANLLGTIVKPNDSIIISGLNGQVNPANIIIEGVDECDPNNTSVSSLYETFIPTGAFPADSCAGVYDLSWIDPSGFPNGTRGYRVYRRVKADTSVTFSAWEFVKTVNGAANTTTSVLIRANTDYIFKIVAFDVEDAVIISAELPLTVGPIRFYEVVPAPELRCSYVNDDGSVKLSFLATDPSRDPSLDSTGNWVSYKFQYRSGGGAWLDVPGSLGLPQDADTLLVTGINAIANSYSFRSTSLSGCSGAEEAPYSTIDLIQPTATAILGDSNKRVSVDWTGTGVFSSTDEFVNKAIGLNNYFNGSAIGRVRDIDPNSLIDNGNRNICDTIANYFITKTDQLSGCLNRSRPDTARIIDQIPPPPQIINSVSYELVGSGVGLDVGVGQIIEGYELDGILEMKWSQEPSDDIEKLMIFAPNLNTGQNDSINTVPWTLRSDLIPNTRYDASDSSYYFSAQSIDACGRRAQNFNDFDYHKNMDVDVNFSPCDSVMNISWNGYYYFPSNNEVEYQVQRLFVVTVTGSNPVQRYILDPNVLNVDLGTTTDTTFAHKVDQDSVEYAYRVIAKPKNTNGIEAKSNWASDLALFGAKPSFNYISYVTVKPGKGVELQLFKDTSIEVGGYTVMRSQDSLSFEAVDRLGPNVNNSLVTSEDLGALTDELSYYYQIIVENECGNIIDTSNVGTSIHLTVEARNEALTNVLRWNEYQGWDSAVAFYNIYRGVNGNPAQTLYATVPAKKGKTNQFVDDVFDNSYSIGNYCYKVEAVQGTMNPAYSSVIAPATSNSNMVCVVQKPLFYVPNAFAPGGQNNFFGPSGQFFDFTKYEMLIYNRWGELIFETRDITKGWDGKVDGEIAALGSYVYAIRFVDADGKEHNRKGTVTLIR